MNIQSVSQHIPTQSANATDEWYVAWPFAGKWLVKAVRFAPATAVAIDGTDYLTSTISANDGAAGSFTTICSHTTNTGGTALAVDTSVAPTVTRYTLVQGSMIKIAKTLAGAGKILDGTYTITAEKIN